MSLLSLSACENNLEIGRGMIEQNLSKIVEMDRQNAHMFPPTLSAKWETVSLRLTYTGM